MQVGLGTWKAEKGDVSKAVLHALKSGQRHFDFADRYQNHADIGEHALKPAFETFGVKRGEAFITTKLWNEDHRPARVKPALQRMLRELQLDYVDLLLIHWPVALVAGTEKRDSGVTLLQTWRAMETLVDAGLARAIGVSNFNVKQLTMIARHARILPAVNQVEMHPYLPQTKLRHFCNENGITVVAYSPLGSPGNADYLNSQGAPESLMSTKVVDRVARKAGKTPAQVLIKWAMQHGAIPIAKSTDPHRIDENFDMWGWSLSSLAMQQLDALKITPWRYVDARKYFRNKQTAQEFWDDHY